MANGIIGMQTPSLGELRFAQALFATERRARRRSSTDEMWRKFFDGAVVLTFVFFLFM